MAFDLVQYFVEQIETQKPELLQSYTKEENVNIFQKSMLSL